MQPIDDQNGVLLDGIDFDSIDLNIPVDTQHGQPRIIHHRAETRRQTPEGSLKSGPLAVHHVPVKA